MRALRVLLASSLLAGAVVAVVAPPAVADAPTPAAGAYAAGTYVAVEPFRAVDTRTGALGNHKGAVAHDHGITATVGGHGGVPVDVAAVAVTITAVAPTAAGAVVAYAARTDRPGVRNLRYLKGTNTAVSAIVRTSVNGKITLFNVARSGSTHLAVDVSGYYVAGTPSGSDPGILHTVTPERVFVGSLTKGSVRTAAIGGHRGVPSTRVGTVAVLITAIAPKKSGSLVAYATGSSRPGESTVHFTAGQSYTQFAIVPTDSRGQIAVYNTSAGSVLVTVDVVGYTVAGIVTTAHALQPRPTVRIVNAARVRANTTKLVTVAGRGGVPPDNVSAVVVTVTVASSAKRGGVVAWQAHTAVPRVTSLQYSAGRTVSNVAIVPVSRRGTIAVRNVSGGSATLYVDVDGFILSNTVAPPDTSIGRYVRNITADGGADVTTMTNEGCEDAIQSKLVLLEFGAQTVTAPLSADNPGVLLTAQTDPKYRLSYDRLKTTITGYLDGFYSCANGAAATIALGTSNDGDYSGPYTPSQRGTDWATEVVAPLRAASVDYPGLTVVGADDVEAGFAGTERQAEEWETAYLGVDNTDDAVGTLIYNGSADGCPTGIGVTGGVCGNGWTQADYYRLAHGISPRRVEVLPQVYLTELATQWANIEASGGNDLVFAGVLTEFAACPAASADCPTASLEPADAWAALLRARSGLATSLRVPGATDLREDR